MKPPDQITNIFDVVCKIGNRAYLVVTVLALFTTPLRPQTAELVIQTGHSAHVNGSCDNEFKPLPPIGAINRVRPRVLIRNEK